MIVAKLTISYDRGTVLNHATDLGAALKKGDVAADGGIVRGLGSRFRSQDAMLAAQVRDKEAHRIYSAFRARFMTTTIDGLYIVPAYGAARAFVEGLNPNGIMVGVSEFELTSDTGLDAAELAAWGGRVKRQLSAVGLGRKKNQIDEAGIKAIKALAECPLLKPTTQDAVKNLVSLLETSQINRADFRKRLDNLNIEIEQIDKAHDARVAKAGKGVAWAGEAVR